MVLPAPHIPIRAPGFRKLKRPRSGVPKLRPLPSYDPILRSQEQQLEEEYLRWGRGTRPEFVVWRFLVFTKKQKEGVDFFFQCLTGGHRVLTADLRWVPVETLRSGDRLLSFIPGSVGGGRGRGRRHYWTEGRVLANEPRSAEVYSVTLSDGTTITTTAEHPWFSSVDGWRGRWDWRPTSELPLGLPLPRLLNTWEEETSWKAGWLAGFYDGEGSLIQTPQSAHEGRMNAVRIAQNLGPTFDRLQETLGGFGVPFSSYHYPEGYRKKIPNRQPYGQVYLSGGVNGLLSFLGRFRPPRLTEKLSVGLLGQVRRIDSPSVVSVEPAGIQEVWQLGVDCETYIAEGFGMHNSSRYGGRQVIGGIVVDFWLPSRFMMWRVQGERFHLLNPEDRMNDMVARIRLTGQGFTVIDLWVRDLDTRPDFVLKLAWEGREPESRLRDL